MRKQERKNAECMCDSDEEQTHDKVNMEVLRWVLGIYDEGGRLLNVIMGTMLMV